MPQIIRSFKEYDPDEDDARIYAKHGQMYDYSKTVYTKATNNIIIGCPIHGDFEMNAYNHIKQGSGCKQCSNDRNRIVQLKRWETYRKNKNAG